MRWTWHGVDEGRGVVVPDVSIFVRVLFFGWVWAVGRNVALFGAVVTVWWRLGVINK